MFVEESQLEVHIKHHESYTPRTGKHKCNICQEAFYQRDMLKRHVLSTHNEVSVFKAKGRKKPKPPVEKQLPVDPLVTAPVTLQQQQQQRVIGIDTQQENLNPAEKSEEISLR